MQPSNAFGLSGMGGGVGSNMGSMSGGMAGGLGGGMVSGMSSGMGGGTGTGMDGGMGGGGEAVDGEEELHALMRRVQLDKLIPTLEENDIDSIGALKLLTEVGAYL